MKIIIDFAYSGSVSVEDNVQELLFAADYLIVTDIIEACSNFLEENLTPENCIGVCRFTVSGPQVKHKAHFLIGAPSQGIQASPRPLTTVVKGRRKSADSHRLAACRQSSLLRRTPVTGYDNRATFRVRVWDSSLGLPFRVWFQPPKSGPTPQSLALPPPESGSALQSLGLAWSFFLSKGALFYRHAGDRTHFTIPDVSAEVMKILIDFAYSGSVYVTEDNVQELLIAADYLIVTDIIEACSNFLQRNLTPENCIGVCRFTVSGPHVHKAHFLLMNKFEEVVSSEEFLELSLQELTDILDSDELNVNDEKTVYKATVRWIDHEPEQRTSHLPALLSKARLALSSVDDIKTLMSDPYLSNNTQCLQILENVLRLKHQLSNSTLPMRFCSNLAARPRLPNTVIFAIGGCSTDGITNIMKVYDVSADCWLDITDNQEKPHCFHGTAFHDGFIYCIGGYDGKDFSNSVRKFDVKRRAWLEAAPMNQRRSNVSVACLDGYIYALGGYDGTFLLRTAERYRPEMNQWSLIAPMKDIRTDAGCAAFKKKIYVCGGLGGSIYFRSCEFYSPESDQWTSITDMSTRRNGLGVVLYDNRIFALGGYDGNKDLKSVEAYDPQTNEWHKITPMLTNHSNCGTAVINNKLFVMGGVKGFHKTNSVEYYDAKTNIWTKAGQMRTARRGVSCCAISNHPILKEYATSRDTFPRLEEE
ncbi:kelch-like protein 10 [Antennarius striatus]|uniref:kelch-like protein 10 n=1 Tax=Antennarius striatus TaxID=241820 RepID=UPI0035AF30D7